MIVILKLESTLKDDMLFISVQFICIYFMHSYFLNKIHLFSKIYKQANAQKWKKQKNRQKQVSPIKINKLFNIKIPRNF